VLAGPWATQQLADQGADVVKVEPPGGDETRRFGPVIDGHSTYYLSANRNKRSIVLDLKTPGGREVLHRLLADADLLMENFRPGVLARLGFDWPMLHARYPRLVYVAVAAFGDRGDPAWVARPGYDLALQAMGGGASITGQPDGPPTKHGNSITDLVAGLLANQAALMALLRRERTGRGQQVVVNMLQAQAACLTYHATRYAVTGHVETRRGNTHGGLVPYRFFPCGDGHLAVACGNDAIWQRLRAALDLPDHPHWRTNVDRVADRDAVDAAVQAALDRLSLDAADALLATARVPAGPVLQVDQVLTHPQVERVPVQHPAFGEVALPGPTFHTDTTRQTHSCPPGLGEHRDAILAEVGYDATAIAALAADGAFG
jgi:crotonobetainyl-CoA:carnitine CoA-transferase CaiB-like acyl-CoA transferase